MNLEIGLANELLKRIEYDKDKVNHIGEKMVNNPRTFIRNQMKAD